MDSQNHWDERYRKGGDSGYGSYGEQLNLKLRLIRNNIKDIKNIVDFGCGDFNFGLHVLGIFPDVYYFGIDQSIEIIQRNSSLYKHSFQQNNRLIIGADLILCVDVLLHILNEKDEKNIIDDLKKHWRKYLVISAFDHDGESEPNGQAVMRRFPEELFGKPIVKELLEPNGMYFYIWKK